MTVSKRITKHFIYAIIFYVSVLVTKININLQKMAILCAYVETQNPNVNTEPEIIAYKFYVTFGS